MAISAGLDSRSVGLLTTGAAAMRVGERAPVTQVGDRPFRAEQPLEVVLVEARHRGVGGGTPSRAVDRAHMSVVARDRRRIGDERARQGDALLLAA